MKRNLLAIATIVILFISCNNKSAQTFGGTNQNPADVQTAPAVPAIKDTSAAQPAVPVKKDSTITQPASTIKTGDKISFINARGEEVLGVITGIDKNNNYLVKYEAGKMYTVPNSAASKIKLKN